MLAASQENDVTPRRISTRFRELGHGTKLEAAGNRGCTSDLSAGRAKTEHPANAELISQHTETPAPERIV
jgi:hypothetical protein